MTTVNFRDALGVTHAGWKVRRSHAGLHFFRRIDGLNVLIERPATPLTSSSTAPRYVSVALTNLCDLACSYCYAPKYRAALDPHTLLGWLRELDEHGCLGVGFGGGEPTLHPAFAAICRAAATETRLAVTFTTHAHRLTERLVDALRGSV